MIKSLIEIPRELDKNNIDNAILNYKILLKDFPTSITSKSPVELFKKIKRKKIKLGPYPNVTLFEAANRIMSDLTILLGIKKLLSGEIAEMDFSKYLIELGSEDNNNFDITASNYEYDLIGEGFNVAKSFFGSKKSSALKKMRKYESNKNILLLLIYNSDAISKKYMPKPKENEFHLVVSLDL